MSNTKNSNTENDTSDIKKAAEQANSQQIEKNLKHDKKTDRPEQLNADEQTSFIKEDLRTDK